MLSLSPSCVSTPPGRRNTNPLKSLVSSARRWNALSPDSRFLSYASNQSGRKEIEVRPFDPSAADGVGQAPHRGRSPIRVAWALRLASGRQGVVLPDRRRGSDGRGGQHHSSLQIAENRGFCSTRRTVTLNPIGGNSNSPDGQQFLFSVPPKRRGAAFLARPWCSTARGNWCVSWGILRCTEPRLSPDGTKVAAFLRLDSLWVFDVSTGKGVQVTTSGHQVQYENSPVWSPDGRQIASPTVSPWAVYTEPPRTEPEKELFFNHAPGVYAPPITDWSPDGRFLTYSEAGAPSWLPVNGDRKAVELLRAEYNVYGVRFSPDSRFVAYVSDESGRNEIYVRPFDSSSGLGDTTWQVSREGGLGLVQWRLDGKELYYLTPNGGVMVSEISTAPSFRSTAPKLLFRAPATFPLVGVFEREGTNAPECSNNGFSICEQGSISRNGQQFVFNVPLLPERREVTVARSILAKYLGTYAEPNGIEWVVTLEGNQLMIQRTGREKAPLFAESETMFFLKASNGDFEFAKDDNGNVICLFLYRGGGPTQLTRK